MLPGPTRGPESLAMGMAFPEIWILVATYRPLSSSFLWFIFKILQGNPQKELPRGLWLLTVNFQERNVMTGNGRFLHDQVVLSPPPRLDLDFRGTQVAGCRGEG